jgi:hypothetical protein
VTISNGCIIGVKCILNTHETLQDNTVIYGSNNQRRIAFEKPQVEHKLIILKFEFQIKINQLI